MTTAQDSLAELYPFLHGRKQDAQSMTAALMESLRQKVADGLEVQQQFFAEHGSAVVNAARAIAQVYRHGGRMLSMGNGGSACDAAHFAVEFCHPVTVGRPALAALDLSADTAMLTAVSNDVGFEHVFARQLLALARAGDGLIGFSTSGNSLNLLRAFASARELGLTTIALVGGDGGRMAQSSHIDHCLVVRSPSIHRVQETHVAIYHIVWDLVHTLLADARGQLPSASPACAPPASEPPGTPS